MVNPLEELGHLGKSSIWSQRMMVACTDLGSILGTSDDPLNPARSDLGLLRSKPRGLPNVGQNKKEKKKGEKR